MQPKLGSGARFARLEHSLAHQPGVHDPAALASVIGRRKLGAKRFNALSHKSHGGMAGYADGGEVSAAPPQTESPEKHCPTCACNGGEPRDAGSWGKGKTHHKTNLMSSAMRNLMTEGN